MADPDYMTRQAEIGWPMRTILMEWLIEVHSKFRLLPETLLISVNLVDRFLTLRVVSLAKLQLVGLTAMFIAAKYEEVICPSAAHFIHMTDESFDVEEMLRADRYMLSRLCMERGEWVCPFCYLTEIAGVLAYLAYLACNSSCAPGRS
jgi:G2/mitotic-specific cyclin 1/2